MFYRFLTVPLHLSIIKFYYPVYTQKFAPSRTLVLDNLSVTKSSFDSFVVLIPLRLLCFFNNDTRRYYMKSVSVILLLARSYDRDVFYHSYTSAVIKSQQCMLKPKRFVVGSNLT